MSAARLSLISGELTDTDRTFGERVASLYELAVMGDHVVTGMLQNDEGSMCNGVGHHLLKDILEQLSGLAFRIEEDFDEGRVKAAKPRPPKKATALEAVK